MEHELFKPSENENEIFKIPDNEVRQVLEGLQDHELDSVINEASEFTETGEAGRSEAEYLDDPQQEAVRARANLIVDTGNSIFNGPESIINLEPVS